MEDQATVQDIAAQLIKEGENADSLTDEEFQEAIDTCGGDCTIRELREEMAKGFWVI